MVTPPDVCPLAEAAAELGMHYDTLRKNWRAWSDPESPEFVDLPVPFRQPQPGKRGRLAWRRTALAEWKRARERALGAGHTRPAPRPDGGAQLAHLAASRDTPRLKRERNHLLQLLERA